MEDTVNAFVDLFEVQGAAGGPLAGLRFASKDIYDVAGHITGCGNPDWARTHPAAETHAPPVSALLDAGASCIGKSHTDELAYSLMGVNAHFGTPVNSGDPRRVPGGSSSGSAAAVAAGLVEIGLGSDTGGSVRLPGSFCGVFGLRTTHGRIAIDRTMPLAPSFDTVGWFTRDLATMRKVSDAMGCASTGPAPRKLLLPVDAWTRASAETVAALAPTLAALQATFGPVEPVILAPEGLVTWREAFRMHQGREVWEAHGDWVTETKPNFGPGIADRFAMAKGITADEFDWAKGVRMTATERLIALLSDGAVAVLPTSPGPAPLRETPQEALDTYRSNALELLCSAGLAGLPQLSIPSGTVDGGPVGFSLLGAQDSEGTLFETAAAI